MNEPRPILPRVDGLITRRYALPLLFIVLALLAAAITRWQFRVPTSASAPGQEGNIGLRPGLMPNQRLTAQIDETDPAKCLRMYLELTGRKLLPLTNGILAQLDENLNGRLSRWRWIRRAPPPDSGITYHGDGLLSAAETKTRVEAALRRAHLEFIPVGQHYLRVKTDRLKIESIETPSTTNDAPLRPLSKSTL